MLLRTHGVGRKFLAGAVGAGALSAPLFTEATARADAETPSTEAEIMAPSALAEVNNRFIQFGVGVTTEFVASDSALCDPDIRVVPHCILGSGAGLVFPRVGWRSPGHWYVGGAYEFSKQDASNVYLLPILQQLRGEARYYFLEGHVGTPFLEGSLGVAGYGNEWTVDAYGPVASLGFGIEAQISKNTVVGATFVYRVLYLRSFVDSAGNERDGGFAQLLGLNVALEARDTY